MVKFALHLLQQQGFQRFSQQCADPTPKFPLLPKAAKTWRLLNSLPLKNLRMLPLHLLRKLHLKLHLPLKFPIPPAASTPTPTVVGATPKPDDETVVGTTPKPDETVVGTTPKPDETVEGPTPRPDETVVGTEVDRFVADLTALAETMPVDTTPAPAPSNASNGTTPNGLVDALNNLANRIPSVTDAVTDGAGDGLTKKQQKAQYMRYYRSVRGPNCPDIIKKKFQEAQSCSPMESQAKIQALFEEFKQCNEDWLTSQIVLKEIRSHTTSHQGIWKWMTRDESWLQVTLFFQTAYMCL